MDFDGVLREVGDFGRYQKMRLLFLGLPVLIGTCHLFLQVFAAGQSDHWCRSWESEDCAFLNISEIQCENLKKEISIPVTISDDNATSFEKCEKYNVSGVDFGVAISFARDNISLETIPCDEGWVYDRETFPSTIVMDFQLVCGKSYLPNIAQSIYLVGRMIGIPLFGFATDIFGRRKTQLFSYFCGIVLGISTAFSLNFWMYVTLRFLTSVLLTGIGTGCIVLANEMVGPSRRVLAGNLMWIFFSAAYGVLAGAAKLIPNWRILQLVVTLPYIPLVILTFFFIHESPRWLVSQRRIDEAEKVMRKMAKGNDKTIKEDFSLEDCTKDENQRSTNIKETFLDLIRSKLILLMVINMTFNWIVQAFVYYGLSLSTSSLGIDPYISFVVSGAIEIPAYSSCVFVAEWFGRKKSTFGTLLLSGICCCVTPLVPLGLPRALVAIMGKFFITMSFSVVITWAVEMTPTSVRTIGVSLFSMASRVGAILAPIMLILEDTWSSLPVLLFGSLSILAALLSLFFPETKGKSLPSTVRDTKELYSNAAFDVTSDEIETNGNKRGAKDSKKGGF